MPASGLVTVTSPAPVVAVAAMVMLAVSEVLDTNVVELTVMPVPENDTVAPDTMLVPVTVMFWLVAPWPRELGLAAVTVGAPFTVNTPVPAPMPVSGFVTVTSRAPVVALVAMVMLAVSVMLDTNVVELTVMPVPENDTVAPDTKLVPVTVTFWLVAPWPREFGVVAVTSGAALIVKQPVQVAGVDPSLLLTVTSRLSGLASALMVMLAVSEVLDPNVVELTVMPVPEND